MYHHLVLNLFISKLSMFATHPSGPHLNGHILPKNDCAFSNISYYIKKYILIFVYVVKKKIDATRLSLRNTISLEIKIKIKRRIIYKCLFIEFMEGDFSGTAWPLCFIMK